MRIHGAMALERARHSLRWALICALLALGGGFATARAEHAEVATATSILDGAARRRTIVDEPAPTPTARPPIAAPTPRPTRHRAPLRRTLPLYLAHRALLL